MKMFYDTLREFIADKNRDDDIDIVDDYDERCWICVSGTYVLSQYGEKEYAQVLNLPVQVDTNWYVPAHVAIEGDEEHCERIVSKLQQLLWLLAGYDDDEYTRKVIKECDWID